MSTVTYTHRGFFGLCPVYFAELETEAPVVEPRHWVFLPLLFVSEALINTALLITSLVRPDLELGFPLLTTGEITPPIVRNVD